MSTVAGAHTAAGFVITTVGTDVTVTQRAYRQMHIRRQWFP